VNSRSRLLLRCRPLGVGCSPGCPAQVMVGSAYFGHALLVELLLSKLRASAPARVVWMSGALEAQAKLDWGDLGCALARRGRSDLAGLCIYQQVADGGSSCSPMLGRQHGKDSKTTTLVEFPCRGWGY
jgi:hypothetical protein